MLPIDRRLIQRVRCPGRFLVALLLAAGLGGVAPVHADLVLSIPTNIPADAGTTDNFLDVSLTVTGTAQIGAFQFTLDLPSSSGVTFISADTTSPNYIFPTSSGIGWTLGPDSLTISAGDLELDPPGYVTLTDTTVSLGRIDFQVATTAPGGLAPVTFDTSATQTLVLDGSGNPLSYSAPSGSIEVTAAAVPEPSTLGLVIMGAVCFAAHGLRRGVRPVCSGR